MRIAKITMAIMFLICWLDVPYGYFQLLRTIGMMFFAYLAYDYYTKQEIVWSYFWIGSAILINPIIKISLGRDLWNVIDLIWAVILIYQVVTTKRNPAVF